jgi:membrane-associated PAP2 superfamily phosphatase
VGQHIGLVGFVAVQAAILEGAHFRRHKPWTKWPP